MRTIKYLFSDVLSLLYWVPTKIHFQALILKDSE